MAGGNENRLIRAVRAWHPGTGAKARGLPGEPDFMTSLPMPPYPESPLERRRWVRALRSSRKPVTGDRPANVFVEREAVDRAGRSARVLTVLLVGRECPWRCVMCDLWRQAAEGPLPVGAVPRQLAAALKTARAQGPLPPVIKLYNSGSFFDRRSVPPEDYPALVRLLAPFQRVVVKCHPRLVGERVAAFQRMLHEEEGGTLEVAMGLETAHPEVLARLNKGMTREDFLRATDFLRKHNLEARAFVLLQPPFMPPAESVEWAVKSAAFAFAAGVSVVAMIPVRAGNGALEALAREGLFVEPTLTQLEMAVAEARPLKRGRLLADLWDLERFRRCPRCFAARRRRLERFNHTQRLGPPVACPQCGGGA
jgi:radical SAM enzyme (TIGR01210 family)